jgi:undecaprenyl-diphosphatase
VRSRRFEWIAVVVAFVAAAGFAWLAWALGRGYLTGFDESTRAAMHAYAGPVLTLVMRAFTLIGTQPVILGGTVFAAVFLFLKGDRDGAWLIAIAMVGAEILEVVLKVQFHRQRPEPFFDTVLPGSYSFPSGHALFSLCLYGLLCWLIGARLPVRARWLIRVAAVVLILAIGSSRVYLGVHHPTDVIAGYLVTIFWIATLLALRGPVKT